MMITRRQIRQTTKALCGYVDHFHLADKAKTGLGIRSMLSSASKIGDPHQVLAFNLPLERTCCSGLEIATPVCRSVCYGHKFIEGRPSILGRAEKNYEIAQRADFARLVVGAIRYANIDALKIHVIGDFFSATYIDAWTEIIPHCHGVKFWAYTRSWRVNSFRPHLRKLAALPSMNLILSADRASGYPPNMPNTEVAWLATDDDDAPPAKSLVVFRSSGERKKIVLNVLGDSPVCPHQNGKPAQPDDCMACGLCVEPQT